MKRGSIDAGWCPVDTWNDGDGGCGGAVKCQKMIRGGGGKIHGSIKARQTLWQWRRRG